MAKQLFTNNAVTELAAGFASGVLVFTVTPGEGALFPNPTAGDWFLVTISQAGLREIVQVTARTTDSFTCVRAQEGTSDLTWLTAASVSLNNTAGFLGTISTLIESDPVLGPLASIDDNIATFDLTTGKLIQDGGQTIAQVVAAGAAAAPQGDVVGPVSAVDERIAVFDLTTGKLVKDGGQTIAEVIAAASSGGGDVVGPASAVDDNIATFDLTTGKLIQDGGQTIAAVIAAGAAAAPQGDVVGPASAVDSHVAMFDLTTGKLLKDSGVGLSGSNTGDALAKEGVMNGSMHVWQRNTGVVTAPNNSVSADRWKTQHIISGSIDVSRVSLGDAAIHTATGQRLAYALKLDVNTVDVTVDASDFVAVVQFIEGFRALPYMHNQFTISFFVRSNVTGTFAMSLRSVGNDRTFVKSLTIDSANTWERKTVTVPTQDGTGTWDYTTGVGLRLGVTLMCGTSFLGTDGIWQTGNFLAVAGISNWMGIATNDFDLTGVQFDLGATAMPYRGVEYVQDRRDCSRFYQKSYNDSLFAGAVSSAGQGAFKANGTTHFEPVSLPENMRAAPTITLYSPSTGTAGFWRDTTTPADRAVTSNSVGEKNFSVGVTTSVDDNSMVGHWTAESEL